MSNNISGEAYITGASSSIGLAIASALAKQGAILSLAARRKEWLDALVIEIKTAGWVFRRSSPKYPHSKPTKFL